MPAPSEFFGEPPDSFVGVPTGLEAMDPLALGRSLLESLGQVSRRPATAGRVLTRQAAALAEVGAAITRHVLTGAADPVLGTERGDRRFEGRAWRDNAMFFALQQSYLLAAQTLREFVAAADVEVGTRAKAEFAAGLLIDSLAPTNFFLTNPVAIERAIDTGGRSVARGVAHFLGDLAHNRGLPRKVDRDAFELGRNLAATPGQVIYRNELMELIQYQPTTEQVYEIPVLMCPPWINRYYIMDLSPGRSLIEWSVEHGFTTFAISYRNPPASMADTTFEDYLRLGPLAAIEAVRSISGAESVNTVSVCLGGTLTAAMLAMLQERGESKLVRSATLLNSFVDYEDAGVLGHVFTDEDAVASIELDMAERGGLDADQLSFAFDLLRANDLIFRPLVSAWLMGEDPPAFDLLAWNAHPTRLPAAMHSFYLRRFWLANDLAQDRLELGGMRLAASDIETDLYIVGAVEDHIVPWRSSYKTTQLVTSDRRFVLTSAGHVAGIVNPPNPKARMWVSDAYPSSPDEWLAGATEVVDTWWNDWISWVTPRSGELRDPPAIGNATHPPLAAAPGTYVLG